MDPRASSGVKHHQEFRGKIRLFAVDDLDQSIFRGKVVTGGRFIGRYRTFRPRSLGFRKSISGEDANIRRA